MDVNFDAQEDAIGLQRAFREALYQEGVKNIGNSIADTLIHAYQPEELTGALAKLADFLKEQDWDVGQATIALIAVLAQHATARELVPAAMRHRGWEAYTKSVDVHLEAFRAIMRSQAYGYMTLQEDAPQDFKAWVASNGEMVHADDVKQEEK